MKKQTWQEVEAEPEIEPIALDESDAFAWKLQLEPPFLPSYPLHQKCVRDVVRTAIRKRLNEHQTRVLFMLFGLDSGQEMTLEEVGIAFQLSRERIRQIQIRAFKVLRRELLRQPDLLGIERRSIATMPPPVIPEKKPFRRPQKKRQRWRSEIEPTFNGVPLSKLNAAQRLSLEVVIARRNADAQRQQLAVVNFPWSCKVCLHEPCWCRRGHAPVPTYAVIRWAAVIAAKTNWRRAPCSPPPTT